MRIKILFFLCIFLTSISAYAETAQKVSQDADDTLKVHASDISRVDYEGALKHLQTLENFIRNSKSIPEVVDSGRFYVGYPNSLLRIEGYALYLEKKLAKAKHETDELKMKAGKINKQALEISKNNLKEAKQAFDDFLAASWFQD